MRFLVELDSLLESTRPIIVAGDSNVDLRRSNLSVVRYTFIHGSNSMLFLNDLVERSITFPFVQGPGLPGSIIDHIATNLLTVKYNLDILDNSLSDHRG